MKGGRIAVFLDRDGTINEEVNFVRTPDELALIPGAASAIRTLNTLGLITCVISNQSGIARGYLTPDDLVAIHAKLEAELRREGAYVDRISYCPHHPTEGSLGYTMPCRCRKPATGMLEDAAAEFEIDLTRSFVVGDRLADVGAAQAAGATSVLVLTGYGRTTLEEAREQEVTPDQIVSSIVEAVAWITQQIKGRSQQHE